ncbi:hypothetical protein ACTJIJ_19845 [Niabella sp. 22666]|uniref:hypothetical protein n=1 Tax=Niabella sp. 22666 TaxID=3453954 RepID=UPI003F87C50B
MINTLNDLQDYLETLCQKNKRVKHSATNRGFARLNTDEHVEHILRKGGKNIVVVASVSAQRVGDLDDMKLRRGVSLMFASKCSSTGDRGDAVAVAMDTAESILISFLNKMEIDQEELCNLDIDFTNASWEEIEGAWLDDYYGYILFMPYSGYLPAFDEADWEN